MGTLPVQNLSFGVADPDWIPIPVGSVDLDLGRPNLHTNRKKNYRYYTLIRQCCGSGIRMDPHQIERKDPYPDPHQSDKLDPDPDPDPLQFADDKPKCMEFEPIWHYFKVLSLCLEARIRIQFRTKAKGNGSASK